MQERGLLLFPDVAFAFGKGEQPKGQADEGCFVVLPVCEKMRFFKSYVLLGC